MRTLSWPCKIFGFTVALFICSCSTSPPPPVVKPEAPAAPSPVAPPPKATKAELVIAATPTVNPDSSGRPSPVIVRTYELTSIGAFKAAELFELLDGDEAVLGKTMLSRDEWALEPGKERQIVKKLHPDTRYFGVVAAFRDFGRSQWRATVPVALDRETLLKIEVSCRPQSDVINSCVNTVAIQIL